MATANRAHTPQLVSSGSTVSAETEVTSEAPVIALLAQYVGVNRATVIRAAGMRSVEIHAPPRKDRARPPMLAMTFAAFSPSPSWPRRKPSETGTSV